MLGQAQSKDAQVELCKGLTGSEHVPQPPPFTSQPLSGFCCKRQWTLTYLLKWNSQSAICQL